MSACLSALLSILNTGVSLGQDSKDITKDGIETFEVLLTLLICISFFFKHTRSQTAQVAAWKVILGVCFPDLK